MKILFIAMFLLVSPIANASVDGEWRGFLKWEFDGDGPECLSEMHYSETTDSFSIRGGYIDCGFVRLETLPLEMKKSRSNLLLNGEVVGHVNTNGLQWTLPYNEEGVSISTTLKIKGEKLEYREEWKTKDGSSIYLIFGTLEQSLEAHFN